MTTMPAEHLYTRVATGQEPLPPTGSERLRRDLDGHLDPGLTTPRSVFLRRTAADHWARVRSQLMAASAGDVQVHAAYSIKTNPHPNLLRLAQSSEMLVEAISQQELRRALELGCPPENVVLNGPGKWWPERVPCGPLRAVFCDSLVELEEVSRWLRAGDPVARVVGVRLRPPGLVSRFGIDVLQPTVLGSLVSAVFELPVHVGFGVHFHVPAEVSSVSRRWSIVDKMLRLVTRLQAATGRPVQSLDIGGGWGPDDLVEQLLPRLGELADRAVRSLPQLREVLIEPGRGLAEPTMAMLTRVLEVRPRPGGGRDVLVDAAVSELPEIARHPHRTFLRTAGTGRWGLLGAGPGDILGRSCMESDVLATGVALAADVAVGDYVAVCDAGAYDVSKSYVFGCG